MDCIDHCIKVHICHCFIYVVFVKNIIIVDFTKTVLPSQGNLPKANVIPASGFDGRQSSLQTAHCGIIGEYCLFVFCFFHNKTVALLLSLTFAAL